MDETPTLNFMSEAVLEAPISESPAAAALDSFIPTETPDLRPLGEERVKGEVPPDFSKLGKNEPEETTEAVSRATDPKKETKGRSEAPEAKEKASKPTSQPAKTEKPKKDEPKTEDTESELPEDDSDLEKIQAKPGAAPHVVKSIGDLKAGIKKSREVARQFKAAVAAKEQEIEVLKGTMGKLPADVEKELQGLRNFHQLFNAQGDPVFQKEYDERILKSEDGIYAILKKHALPDKVLAEIKSTAAKNGGEIESWKRWPDLINKLDNPLDKQTLLNALQDRRNAVAARQGQLEKLQQDRDGFYRDLATKDRAEKDKWASEVAQAATKDVSGEEWAQEKSVPEGASAEAKKLAEEHNAKVAEYGKKWQENTVNLYKRDPKTVATLAFAAVRAGHFKVQADQFQAKMEKAEERAADLEAQLAKIKGAGRIAHVATTAPETSKRNNSTVKEGEIGGSGQDAFAEFFGGRR